VPNTANVDTDGREEEEENNSNIFYTEQTQVLTNLPAEEKVNIVMSCSCAQCTRYHLCFLYWEKCVFLIINMQN
jgi:hypothetical protein